MLRAESSTRRAVHEAGPGVAWLDHAVLAIALGVLLISFRSVVGGIDWWITTFLVAALVGLTCAVARAVGVRWVAPLALAVEALALTWIFVPQTLLAVVPTWSSLTGIADMLGRAQTIIIEEQAPVAAAQPVVLVLAGSFGLIVVVADVLLRRRGAAASVGLLLVAVYATPALISGTTPSFAVFALPAALWLVLLRSRTRDVTTTGWPTRIPAVAVAVGAVATSLALPPLLPDVTAVASTWGKPPPAVFGRGINPMLELGQNLRRNSTAAAAQYTTTLPQAPYLKVATLRDFTGKTWRPAVSEGDDRFEGRVGLDRDVVTTNETTTVQIRDLRSSMLPIPYPALDVTGLKGGWTWQRLGMTIRSSSTDTRNQRYTVTSISIRPTATQMRALTTVVGPTLQPYVDLPADVPPVISDTARKVTAGATNDYDRARALQEYLRNGEFTYSEKAPVADDYDGNGLDVLATFLKKKAGYCVHFSSAMAVMARTIGIPSRIAVGYAPGSPIGVQKGRNVYEVTSDDLHAWTELYFDGVGWTRFDPTPSVGSGTAFAEPDEPANIPDAAGQVPGAETARPDDLARDGLDPEAATSDEATAPRSALVVGGGLLLVLAAPGLVRLLVRRRRLAHGTGSPDPLWREIEATARDLGVTTSPGDTPRGFAARLGSRPGVDEESLERLLTRVETARFARPGPPSPDTPDNADDARRVIDSLRAGAGRAGRLRAAALPRSLAGRPRPTVPRGPALQI